MNKSAWQLIKKNFISLLLFEFTYRASTFLLVMEFSKFWVGLSLQRNNYSYLTAENFMPFLQNPITMVFLLITGIMILFFLLLEVSAVFVCLQFSYNNLKLYMTDMLFLGFRRMILFLKYSKVTWVFCVLFSVPFLCIHFVVREVYYIKVLNYAAIAIYEAVPVKWLLFAGIAVFVLGSFLFVFTLPYCLLEGHKSLHGMIDSMKLLFQNFKRTIGGLVVVNLVVAFILLIVYVVAVLLASLYVYLTKDPNIAIGVVLSMDEWIEMGIGIVGGAIALVGNLAFIYRLYILYVNEQQPKRIPFVKWELRMLSKKARRRAAAALGLILVIMQLFWIGNFIIRSNQVGANVLESTRITAHRGVSITVPENSMLSLEKSIEALVDYAEIDVQETQDGEVILMHDNNLRRTTGYKANVWDVDYEEIRSLQLLDRSGEDNEVQLVPTLREVIELCQGRLDLNIEIKYNGRNEGIVEKVVRLIEEYDFAEQCVISSMNYDFIRRVKELNEDITTGYIMSMTYGSVSNIPDADFLSVKWTYITENFIKEAHENGKQVHAWTVNYRGAAEKMKTLSVDNIITDNPALVKEVIMAEDRTTTYMELLRYVFN